MFILPSKAWVKRSNRFGITGNEAVTFFVAVFFLS